IIAFNSAILIGLYVKYFKTLSIKSYLITNLLAQSTIFISAIAYHTYVAWIILVPIVSIIGLCILILNDRTSRTKLTYLFIIAISLLNVMVSFVFIKNQIYFEDHKDRANTFYLNSNMYSSELQRALVKQMNHSKRNDERIDWRVNEQDNTPMYQHFKGLSLYSSIFHHNILDDYYDDLKINLAEESLSRYQSTNGRQNIASLFSIRYVMLKDYQHNIPSYFKKVKSAGQYSIYENTLNLPSVKVTNHIYDKGSLKTPIDREHAMLDGVVLDNKGANYNQRAKNLLNQVDISSQNIVKLNKHRIKVTQSSGKVKLHLPKKLQKRYTDFYLTMKIKRGLPDSNYTVNINQYSNNRLYNDSVYRIGVDTQLYRTQPDKNGDITIQLSPKGTFDLQLLNLNGENYDTLKKAHQSANFNMTYHDIKNGVKVNLDKHSKGMATINIPYRSGMKAFVDGEQEKVYKANGMMTAVPVDKNAKTIVIKYQPPFWNTMIFISISSIFISWLFVKYIYPKKRKKRTHSV
ncbi:YfhO family protein, partial [Staphylococcus warneri]